MVVSLSHAANLMRQTRWHARTREPIPMGKTAGIAASSVGIPIFYLSQIPRAFLILLNDIERLLFFLNF